MARLRRLRADISPVDSVERYRSLGVDVFLGSATFTGPEMVDVNGQSLRFRRAVIATGARAAVPAIPGLADTPFDTNETLFTLTARPEHLLVIGGGPIGVEMAQAFARFGSRVTIVHSGARVLPRDDDDAAAVVAASLAADGVRVVSGARLTAVSHRPEHGSAGRFTIAAEGNGEPLHLEGDRLLVAAGRTPNVDGLGLETAGIAATPRGVTVDARLRTSNRRVFAIGDVAGPQQFTHVADAHARLVVANALFFGIGGGRASRLAVPRVTYADPEVAHVGLTRARQRALISFAANRRIHNLWQSTLPSRFVGELPEAHVARIVQPGLWGGGRRSGSYDPYDQRVEWVAAPPPAAPRRAPIAIEAAYTPGSKWV